MSSKMKLVLDLLERTFFTWLEAFVGFLVAANWVFPDDSTVGKVTAFLSTMQVAALAAVPAALAVIKAGLASLGGNRNTAAALPAAVDNGA